MASAMASMPSWDATRRVVVTLGSAHVDLDLGERVVKGLNLCLLL
jgi:hypothetical protein